jgi:hypothetical protein
MPLHMGIDFANGPDLAAITIWESRHCVERVQFRYPKSKKLRIRKKWAKREENVRYEPRAYLYNKDTILCHPAIAKRLRQEIAQK